MTIQTWDNPMGTAGFEFVEFAAPDPVAMGETLERMGFHPIARHRHKDVLLYRQGGIHFIINAEPDSFAQRFARMHGPSVCAIAFRVQDAAFAYRRALELGAWGFEGRSGPMELNIPAIKGVGDSLIYLVDRWRGKDGAAPGDIGDISVYDVDFQPLPGASRPDTAGHGLLAIDHLTHNVHRGRMQEWASFYERLFNFREIRYFDIEGQVSGVKSKAMTSPCGLIRIPINEEGKEKGGQIQEYLDAYHGEGIQHIALSSSNLPGTVDAMRERGIALLRTRDTYYELVDKRIPNHGLDLEALRQRQILVDGSVGSLLLQIFRGCKLKPDFFPTRFESAASRVLPARMLELTGPAGCVGVPAKARKSLHVVRFASNRIGFSTRPRIKRFYAQIANFPSFRCPLGWLNTKAK